LSRLDVNLLLSDINFLYPIFPDLELIFVDYNIFIIGYPWN